MTDTQAAENPRAGIGGNNPPEPIDPLIIEYNERIDTAQKWLDERKEITDSAMADRAAFFIQQVDGTWKALDEQRLEEGRVFKAAQDAKYKGPLGLLVTAKAALVKLRNAWLAKEQAKVDEARRVAQAEADRVAKVAAEAIEAARKEEAAKGTPSLRTEQAVAAAQEAVEQATARVAAVPAKAHIRGAYTTRAVSLRTIWNAKITNLSAAFRHYKSDPIVLAAIEEAILRVAKRDAVTEKDVSKAPDGIAFFSEQV